MAGLGVGEPLSGATRDLLRPRLGVDVSGVRIHTGPAADCNARALGAQAFTFGQDVVFAEGRYDPSTRAGLELLTHELVHVGQQSSQRPARSVQRDGKPREGTVTDGKASRESAPARSGHHWCGRSVARPGGSQATSGSSPGAQPGK